MSFHANRDDVLCCDTHGVALTWRSAAAVAGVHHSHPVLRTVHRGTTSCLPGSPYPQGRSEIPFQLPRQSVARSLSVARPLSIASIFNCCCSSANPPSLPQQPHQPVKGPRRGRSGLPAGWHSSSSFFLFRRLDVSSKASGCSAASVEAGATST